MSLVSRIDTVCVKVRDIEKSSSWYQEILGLKEYYKEEHYAILKIGNGSIPLTLEKGEPTGQEHATYPIFFSSSLDEAHQSLSNRGVKVSDIYKDGLNTYFEFYDIDGNKSQICYWK